MWTGGTQMELRLFQPGDLAALMPIFADEQAMQYFGAGRPLTPGELDAHLLPFALSPVDARFRPWTVRDSAGGEVIGWGGLYVDPHEPGWGLEVGYIFHPRVWGRGLATQLVRASLAAAFRHDDVPQVNAYVRPANEASRRVLAKNGFARRSFVPALEREWYQARRPDPPSPPHPGRGT